MTFKKSLTLCVFCFAIMVSCPGVAQSVKIDHQVQAKKVVFGNEKIRFTLDYNNKAVLSALLINGKETLRSDKGIYNMIRTGSGTYSTEQLAAAPSAKVTGSTVTLDAINYGDTNNPIKEKWTFTVSVKGIDFDITRTTSKEMMAEEISSPLITFDNINTWEGAYQDYGGLAWFYLFNKQQDTYGVHSQSSEFWNSKTGNGLTISATSPGNQVAMKYTRTTHDELAFTVSTSNTEMLPRFDADTKRRRYVRDTTDVWAPVKLAAGTTQQRVTFSWFDYEEKFGRGTLKGINQQQVSSVLNTIARIGVIGKKHFGGNSWHTPYGPICLHEQYIAQMGLGINDDNYLDGYKECLNHYRDNAIKPDGRVWPRWAYSNEDAMPGIFTDKGFYEAQWGYLLDSNPDLVINVAELFDQNGDVAWVKTHQQSCEKALDWILRRDSNGNGLVEMMTDSHKDKKGSDWIDIIWAAYENAFVNAKLYFALTQWAEVETVLGNQEKANYYTAFAKKLKASFNKSTSEGGFWDVENKCYIHWRDKDGSIHGRNMVTPVNFMAIAYGICDDQHRSASILDAIETQMQKENLFFWPICLYTYAPGEGNDWQFPFPNYENGDIFLSWGAVAARAYASYKPEIALKYINKVLEQYAKDGLAFQRYGRAKQDGLGDDILSGNALSVVGLYQAIYGINPKHNRFYLDPHITADLVGTQLKYNYRNQRLTVDLNGNTNTVSNDRFKVVSFTRFGFYAAGNTLSYFHEDVNGASMNVTSTSKSLLTIEVKKWDSAGKSFVQSFAEKNTGKVSYEINGLKPGTFYTLFVDKHKINRVKSDSEGTLAFDNTGNAREIEVTDKE